MEQHEQEQVEDLELEQAAAEKVKGGGGKQAYLTYGLTNVVISGSSAPPPPPPQ